ncbi:hypothetical protein ABBQ32_012742 [Trebouxia sp. C0010 RCD-2024]
MRRIHVVKAVKRTFKDVQMMAQLPALLVGLYNLPVWCDCLAVCVQLAVKAVHILETGRLGALFAGGVTAVTE